MLQRPQALAPWQRVALDRGDVGVRLDRALMRHLRLTARVSRTRIQKAIDAGDVLVNGRPAPRAAWRLAEGDDVRVRLDDVAPRERPTAEPMALDVVYEDDDLLVLNKPAGVVVHPSYKHASGTLMNGVLDLARRWPEGTKPGLLGRLDKQTSGLVVVAKRTSVLAALQRAMYAEHLDKDYLAVVHGKPTPLRGTIDLALDRDPWDRRRVTVTDRGGQPSVTRYERLATHAVRGGLSAAPSFSLLRCRLVTGRMHQIRVHLAAKCWPIVGDPTYGREGRREGTDAGSLAAARFPRQALHAWRLELPHPDGRRRLVLTAEPPEDIVSLCDDLGLALPVVGDDD